MHIALFCATRRGYRFVQKVAELAPNARLSVFSFKEEPWEPPFLDDIRQLALSHGAEFVETKLAGSEKWQSRWGDVDLMFAVNWRYIIPARVFERARLGAYVFHDSLLPVYRGFSPTVWALINGEDHTGVTLFEMVEDYDAGAVIGQARVSIAPDDTIAVTIERVTEAYLNLLETHLPALMNNTASRYPQDESLATYTCKLMPEDFKIDWSWPTTRIYNLIRATTAPYAGAYTTLNSQKLTIWAAQRLSTERQYVGRIPGRIIDIRAGAGVTVLTGDGALMLTRVQLDGQEAATADTVLHKLSFTLR